MFKNYQEYQDSAEILYLDNRKKDIINGKVEPSLEV